MAACAVAHAASFPIKVSGTNPHVLVDQKDIPFMVLGDSPHSLFSNLSTADAAVYLADWMALTMARERSAANLRPWFAGFAEGWHAETGGRRPISLRTAWRMTLAGRPPVI